MASRLGVLAGFRVQDLGFMLRCMLNNFITVNLEASYQVI